MSKITVTIQEPNAALIKTMIAERDGLEKKLDELSQEVQSTQIQLIEANAQLSGTLKAIAVNAGIDLAKHVELSKDRMTLTGEAITQDSAE